MKRSQTPDGEKPTSKKSKPCSPEDTESEKNTKFAERVVKEVKETLTKTIERFRNHNSISTLNKEALKFQSNYEQILKEGQSKLVLNKVKNNLSLSTNALKDMKKDQCIRIAVVGPTGVGKSFIVNTLATMSEDCNDWVDIVANHSESVNDDAAAVSFFPTEIEYADDVTVQVTKPGENQTTHTTNFLITGSSLHEKLLNVSEVLAGLGKQYKNDKIDSVRVQAPLKVLKEHNITLMDIPGLTDDDDDVISGGLKMAREADILFLVLSTEKRKKLESSTINIIQDLLNRKIDEIPFLVLVENSTKGKPKDSPLEFPDPNNVKEHLIKKMNEFKSDGSKYLPQLSGEHRVQVFNRICLFSDGFVFTDRREVKKQLSHLDHIVKLVRKIQTDKQLMDPHFKILSSVYEIRKDLENKKRFSSITIHDGFSFHENKDMWKVLCQDFLSDIEVSDSTQNVYKKVVKEYLPFDLLHNLFERRLWSTMEILLHSFLEQM